MSNGSNNVSRYFSKKNNERVLDLLIKSSTLDIFFNTLRVTSNRYGFGERICQIHSYSVTRNDKEIHLKFFYTSPNNRGPFLYTLFYKKELGFLRIDSKGHSSSKSRMKELGNKPYPVIRDFCKAASK